MIKTIAAILALLFGWPVYPQQSSANPAQTWTYNHVKDALTDKEADEFSMKGKYVYQREGAPELGLFCYQGKLQRILVSTGVALPTRQLLLGSNVTTIRIRIDDKKPRTDSVAKVLPDSTTLEFSRFLNGETRTPIFLLKRLVIGVEAYGTGQVEIEFDIPPDSEDVQKDCRI